MWMTAWGAALEGCPDAAPFLACTGLAQMHASTPVPFRKGFCLAMLLTMFRHGIALQGLFWVGLRVSPGCVLVRVHRLFISREGVLTGRMCFDTTCMTPCRWQQGAPWCHPCGAAAGIRHMVCMCMALAHCRTPSSSWATPPPAGYSALPHVVVALGAAWLGGWCSSVQAGALYANRGIR
jgi:hypothetical protein